MNTNFKCLQIKGKINKLRSEFRKEHEIITRFSDDLSRNSNEEELNQTSWIYEKMSFLKDYINDGRKRSKRVSN